MKIFRLDKLCILLVILVMVELCLTMYLASWRSTFWDAVEHHNYSVFVHYLAYFIIVALALCFVGSYEGYLVTMVSLTMRTRLTKKALQTQVKHEALSQIQQEDCLKYGQLLVGLIVDGLRNLCLLFIYGYFVYKVNPLYLLYPFIYSLISSIVGYKLAFPLISLNYINQNMEAKFRQQLTKINYGKTFVNNFHLARATKLLGYWQIGVGQISVVLPYICLASLYFSYKITFGTLMQVASAPNSMTDCLSFWLNSFNDINKFLSCRKRLQEIQVL